MANLTNKQMVVQSLKSLHNQRIKVLFRLKALKTQKKSLLADEKDAKRLLDQIQKKMVWEVNTNSKTLGDRN